MDRLSWWFPASLLVLAVGVVLAGQWTLAGLLVCTAIGYALAMSHQEMIDADRADAGYDDDGYDRVGW